MIRIKEGVDLAGIAPEMVLGLQTAHSVYNKHGHDDMTVTSARDGKHKPGSKHYVGLATDLRTISAGISYSEAQAIVFDLKQALGSQYDVVNEVDHIHLEFDPKVGAL